MKFSLFCEERRITGLLAASLIAAFCVSNAALAADTADTTGYKLEENEGKGKTYWPYYDVPFQIKDDSAKYCVASGSTVNRLASGKWRIAETVDCKDTQLGGSAKPIVGKAFALADGYEGAFQDSSGGLTFAYGGIVVPYKLQLSGKQETSKGGPTAALYLGGKLSFASSDVDVTFFGFGGSADVTVPIAGEQTSLFGISYGAGINFGINGVSKNLDLGIVVGFDHVDDSKNYEYNDKPWIGIALSVGN